MPQVKTVKDSQEVESVSKLTVRCLVDGISNQKGKLVSVLTGSGNTNCALCVCVYACVYACLCVCVCVCVCV